jgi:hypothetical protein
MKNVALVLLLAILTFGIVTAPSYVFASNGNSGSSHMDDDHDDEDEDEDEDEMRMRAKMTTIGLIQMMTMIRLQALSRSKQTSSLTQLL